MRFPHLAVLALALATGAAHADTLVCRNGRILQPGMTAVDALAKCGAPDSKDIREEDVRAVNQNGYSVKVGKVITETWRYDRGRQKPAALVVVREGKIISIDFE
jgi:hypothetical protein